MAHGQEGGCIKKAPAEAGASRGSGEEGNGEGHGLDAQATVCVGQCAANGIDTACQGADLYGQFCGGNSAGGAGRVAWVTAWAQNRREACEQVAANRVQFRNGALQVLDLGLHIADGRWSFNCQSIGCGLSGAGVVLEVLHELPHRLVGEEKPADARSADWEGRCEATTEGMGAGHGLGLCGSAFSGNDGRQFGRAVHMVKSDDQAICSAEVDDLARHVGRQGLTAFVVAHIPLSATDTVCQGLLRHVETFANGLEVVHASIISPTDSYVNSPTV